MHEPYRDGDIVQAHESDLLHRDACAIGGVVATQAGLHHLCIDNNPMAHTAFQLQLQNGHC